MTPRAGRRTVPRRRARRPAERRPTPAARPGSAGRCPSACPCLARVPSSLTPMTSPAPFGRMLTAMATAFTDDGAVDLDGTAAIAHHLVEHGHDGVVVSGTTGESPTCSVAETADILRVVKDAVGEKATVIAGVGSNSTGHSVELARQAEKLGADALLLVTPYYSKPGQDGLLHHFQQVVQ